MLIGIVGHLKRAEQARALQKNTRAAFVSLDNGSMGCEANHRRVWEWLNAHKAQHDWLVVLEEDATPCTGFVEQLSQALQHAPAPIVSLYAGRERPPQYQFALERAVALAEAEDASWMTSRVLMHAVAVAIRAELVADLLTGLAWSHLPIDEAINSWAAARHNRVAYAQPSPVDHADGETLIQHRDGQPRPPGRIAWRHGTRTEWTGRQVIMSI